MCLHHPQKVRKKATNIKALRTVMCSPNIDILFFILMKNVNSNQDTKRMIILRLVLWYLAPTH